ncbi:bifunctional nitrate reductase/sulfite reductase flavoprotein subunit alpha [Microbacterium gilvum]|uniref:bifunctional nitrate reductase/sulfite reductase flavoprotein subunit alpha n=1 Tax=Microbacterium gilvum TaxID=1336204 RepID=UPI0031EE7F5E
MPTRSVCSYCGVGCGIVVETAVGEAGARVDRVSGDRGHPTNHGRLCTKGATHAELMAAPGRMTTAHVRASREAERVAVPRDVAVADAGRRLRAIVDEHGPDAVALYVSGQMTMEAQYLANKLVKGWIRGIHIESNSRLCMASAGTGYKQSLGADGPPGSYEDIDAADLFLVIGSNTADCHPILFLRMADRLKAGARLIVVDPRRTATADRADLFLQIAPGTDLALLNGLLHLLVADGAVDDDFIAAHTEGWESMAPLLADYPPAVVARITGLAEDDIRTAARWIADAGEWMTLWTMGLNQSTHGTWNTNAICNLHLATGAICRTGSGPFSLTGQPNAMGGREMGYMGPGLPGQRAVFSAEDRALVEDVWGIERGAIRAESGTGTIDMYRDMADGRIRAAWIICTNPVASVANRDTVIRALQAAELVIVQDVYTQTATAAYADILLPATLWVESEGVTVNSDRTLTLVPGIADAPGDARPDWQTICDVAQAMGYDEGFSFASAEEVFDEIRRFWNPQTGWDVRGVDYARLRRGPVQWPAPPSDGDDRHPLRYLNDGVSQHLHVEPDGTRPRLAFATPSRRAQFLPRPHIDPSEMPDDEYPLVLNTGRLQHQWHTMTKTGRVAKLGRLTPGPFLEIHPRDAEERGIAEGDEVEVASRRGVFRSPAVVTDRVRPGGLFAPFHWNDEHGAHLTVNAVTSDAVDEASRQPEFKIAAVSVRRIGPAAATPAAEPAGLPAFAVTPPEPTPSEQLYLAGFLSGLAATPPPSGIVPILPSTAALRDEVRAWFDGLLAGTYSRVAALAAPAGPEITVLWASQTGNAEDFAHACVAAAAERGLRARLVGMAEARVADLAHVETLLVVTSTFGTGGPPDNGSAFWDELRSDAAPALDGLPYAVLAMGDSSYDDFCAHGRGIDRRLRELGAVALVDRVDCEPFDEVPAAQWLQRALDTITGGAISEAPAGPVDVATAAAAPVPAPAAPFTRRNPLPVALAVNALLSGSGSQKEVRRIGFDLGDAGVSYEAGDALGVVCVNAPDVVADWLDAAGLDPAAVVHVDGQDQLFEHVLRTRFDITRIGPDLLAFIAERNRDQALAALLRRDGRARLEQHLWGMHAADLLREFPVTADPGEWTGVLGRLAPRQYSISSSPKEGSGLVELTVSVVRFRTDDDRARGGVCSTFLADRAHEQPVPVYLQRSAHFRPPADPTAGMIMIGPGTGVAPFRGFLHDRRADGHTGRNWLFFGEQHEATDFYYRDELVGMHDDGFLTRLDTAFSRDQRQKVYVQDRMREHGAELWRWIQDGASVFVCGDAERMAKDVDAALLEIARVHGGLSDDAAQEFKKQLTADRRYARDVY